MMKTVKKKFCEKFLPNNFFEVFFFISIFLFDCFLRKIVGLDESIRMSLPKNPTKSDRISTLGSSIFVCFHDYFHCYLKKNFPRKNSKSMNKKNLRKMWNFSPKKSPNNFILFPFFTSKKKKMERGKNLDRFLF